MRVKALRFFKASLLFTATAFLFSTFVVAAPEVVQDTRTDLFPKELELLVQHQQSCPRYVEAGYSPLGRSPVVDAVLGDPFYLPTYGLSVSKILKEKSQHNSLFDLSTAAFHAGGISVSKREFSLIAPQVVPERFLHSFGPSAGKKLYSYWLSFIQVYREAEAALNILSHDEKEWLRQNYNAFFFGNQKKEEYEFFTTDSAMPMKFFELASRVDLTILADCARNISFIVDEVHDHLDDFNIKEKFVWEEQGLKFIISGLDHVDHTESADFFIDCGGSNTFHTMAGGTDGTRAAALHIDLLGNNSYIGNNFVQGSGFLGVGVLANFSGNNSYKANSYSQGCGFFGTGCLMNLGGNNRFEVNFGGQSCALFGSSLLWNKKGGNTYVAHEGMAQGASSTLGVAFLVDNEGGNSYTAGIAGTGGTLTGGIGQGGSTGVRYYPWIGNPSFYGGVSFLYAGKGNNRFMTPWLGQGSAYFLSAGIAVLEGSNNTLTADFDAQGQGLHLSAGLLLQIGGNSHYKGGWGSMGAAGDRAVGMCINTGGNNLYEATEQSIGSARKPKALGVFIDTGGKNSYTFQNGSCGNVQWPETPLNWPTALFLELGGGNRYPQFMAPCDKNHGIGIDTVVKSQNVAKDLFEKFPQSPRAPYSILASNTAYRPLKQATNAKEIEALVQEILTADYDHRRQLYESIDAVRFSHPNFEIDLSELLANPATIPEDQLNYAILWALLNKSRAHLDDVIHALNQGLITSEYARKMAIIYVGKVSTQDINPLLATLMCKDPSEENRATAAGVLANRVTASSINLVQLGLESKSEVVRYAIAKGLQNSTIANVLPLVTPLFQDPSFYVRRAAALTAISLHDKNGIPVLLETLKYNTLDTEENYGDNIYNALAQYVGVNFGVNKDAWMQWWNDSKNTFEFPAHNKTKS